MRLPPFQRPTFLFAFSWPSRGRLLPGGASQRGTPPRGQDEPGEQWCSQDNRNHPIVGKEDGNGREQNHASSVQGRWALSERRDTASAWEGLGPRVRVRGLPVGSQLFKWDEATLKWLWKGLCLACKKERTSVDPGSNPGSASCQVRGWGVMA